MLKLDSLSVRVADLRSKSLNILHRTTSSLDRIKAITLEAKDLQADLATWSQDLPEEWDYSGHSARNLDFAEPDFVDGKFIHVYSSASHAAVWNRYRAFRIITISMCMRLVSLAKEESHNIVKAQLEVYKKTIALLTIDLCNSLPFFFNLFASTEDKLASNLTKRDGDSFCIPRQVVPMIANLTAWPIAVAICTEFVPELQKQWLQRILHTIATSAGNGVLEYVAGRGEFVF